MDEFYKIKPAKVYEIFPNFTEENQKLDGFLTELITAGVPLRNVNKIIEPKNVGCAYDYSRVKECSENAFARLKDTSVQQFDILISVAGVGGVAGVAGVETGVAGLPGVWRTNAARDSVITVEG